MLVDMPITTQTVDSSGEILHLKGLDISDFLDGNAWANWEHNNDVAENIVGKFVFAKKIFSKEDCDTDRQKMYWDKMKTPFLYGICELMDEELHPGAVAIAAMIRYFRNRKEPVKVGASIEGQTLDRKDGDLLRTVGRRVAITLRPCNKQCWVDFLGEGEAVDKFIKSSMDDSGLERLVEIDSAILEDDISGDSVAQLRKALRDLNKTLSAGGYNVAPGALSGGAALQVEDRSLKNRARAAYRDWDRTRPLKEVIKAALPEVSEAYVDHFVDLARDLSLKKGMDPNLVRIGAQHAMQTPDQDQSKLVEGLYWDPQGKFKPKFENYSASSTYKLRNDAGRQVFAKDDPWNNQRGQHHHGSAYYRLAKDFFGMGDHVPATAAVQHPQVNEGRPLQVQTFLEGMKSPLTHPKDWSKALQSGREDGSAHKLALMDMIMGNSDRHVGNVLVHDGKIQHIDNDMSFENKGGYPFYLDPHGSSNGLAQDHLHIDAAQWLRSLSPRQLLSGAAKHGIVQGAARGMLGRLKNIQEMGRAGFTLGQIAEANNRDRLE